MKSRLIKKTTFLLMVIIVIIGLSACDLERSEISTFDSESAILDCANANDSRVTGLEQLSYTNDLENKVNAGFEEYLTHQSASGLDFESSYSVSMSVEEQFRNEYDRYITKNNDKWENNWESSTVSPTSSIRILVSKDAECNSIGAFNGVSAFPLDATNTELPISIALQLFNDDVFVTNKCVLNAESKRTYKNIDSSTMGSGMLIIEKSYDNSSWSRVDSDEYRNGLFTTNFRTIYGSGNTVVVYSPSGEDLNQGVYIRVTYVYEADHTYIGKNIFGVDKEKTDSKMFRERGVFYLCNENLDGVTVHNLSLTSSDFPEEVKNENGDVSEEYRRAETLIDGSMTVTGFKIDNPMANISISVIKNGCNVSIPESGEFTSSGKYEICMTQRLGLKSKTITVYVDDRSSEEIKDSYFPDNFISGKRIYWDGAIPMFEGGLTNYKVSAVDSLLPAVYGTITNITTGDVITIFGDRASKEGQIISAGEYVAQFYNNPTFNTDTPSGDTVIITYRFMVIENGTAPGPQINKQSLLDYCTTNASDYNPKYYGVTYSSAGPGNITVMFSNYQDAFDFAYNYEKGCVEEQSDGTFRYFGTLKVGVKEKFDSIWDLTDATSFFADQAVQELYIDLTDDFTYITLEKSVIDGCDNLRRLELEKSVYVFADEDQRSASVAGNRLPVIAGKKYQYLNVGINGTVSTGINDFEFVKDENGYDSHSVKVVDSKGNEFVLEYNVGVAEQLEALGCASGIITIKEETVYGDKTEYEAIFISENVNTTKATINYYVGDEEKTVSVSQSTLCEKLTVNAFSFESLSDELDPFALVKVISGDGETYYTFDDALTQVWYVPGDYTVVFVNRLGYAYQVEFLIEESRYISISFSGEGAENLSPVLVTQNQTNIILPVATRYGYKFCGYKDQFGNSYYTTIEALSSNEDITLSPIWEAKEVNVTLKNNDGSVIQKLTLKFGAEYVLTTPQVRPGYKFVGWRLNGELMTNSSIVIKTEQDIELIADITKEESTEGSNEDNNATEATTETHHYYEYSTGCSGAVHSNAILVAILASIFMLCIRKREKYDQ